VAKRDSYKKGGKIASPESEVSEIPEGGGDFLIVPGKKLVQRRGKNQGDWKKAQPSLIGWKGTDHERFGWEKINELEGKVPLLNHKWEFTQIQGGGGRGHKNQVERGFQPPKKKTFTQDGRGKKGESLEKK